MKSIVFTSLLLFLCLTHTAQQNVDQVLKELDTKTNFYDARSSARR